MSNKNYLSCNKILIVISVIAISEEIYIYVFRDFSLIILVTINLFPRTIYNVKSQYYSERSIICQYSHFKVKLALKPRHYCRNT